MPNNESLAWLRTQADVADLEGNATTAGHARAVLEMVEGLDVARRTMELNATRLERIMGYAVKHGPDVSVTKALAGICEDLTVSAIGLHCAPAPSHQRGVLGRRP